MTSMQKKVAPRSDKQIQKILFRNYPIKCYLDLEDSCSLSQAAATPFEGHDECQAQVQLVWNNIAQLRDTANCRPRARYVSVKVQ